MFWPCLERGDGLTEAIVYKYLERENAKSRNGGPPKVTFKMAKATGYIEHRVRRDVAAKS